MDWFYDGSNNSGEPGREQVTDRDNPMNFYTLGAFAGYEALYRRWSFYSGWGFNLWHRYNYSGSPFYQRFGIRYTVWDGVAVGVGLKARTFAADYIEWHLAYNLF
ncbi:MAG: hypothetical protein ACK4KT_03725 [Thermaurantimonas sp.]